MKTQRGNIDFDQIRTAARQGDGEMFQMFGGGSTTDGNVPKFDADGNVVDSGKVAENIGGASGTGARWVLVDSDIASDAAAIVLDTGIDDTDRWMLDLTDLIPATDNTDIRLQVSTDGGSTWEATGYRQNSRWFSSSGTIGQQTETTYLVAVRSPGSASGEYGSGRIYISRLGSSSKFKQFYGQTMQETGSDTTIGMEVHCSWANVAAVNAIRIYAASGNISGTAKLYKWVDA